jgi:hypothetical protein
MDCDDIILFHEIQILRKSDVSRRSYRDTVTLILRTLFYILKSKSKEKMGPPPEGVSDAMQLGFW